MNVGRLLVRGLVGGLFIGHGTQKLAGWFGGPGLAGTDGMMESMDMRPARRNSLAAGVTETAGGVTAAVLRRLAERGEISPGETVVAYITGDGLKTIDAVVPAVATIDVPADVDAVAAALEPAAVT